MEQKKQRATAHEEIDAIFREILPRNGMAVREAQISLCHTMLNTMQNNHIALCDAGTGIGKTYAYLVAGIILQRHSLSKRAILISTSSIALQKSILYEYIPFLSAALLGAGLVDHPITAVVRKGKSHYVCDERLNKRICRACLDRKNPKRREALLSLWRQIDMDEAPKLNAFDRRQIRVETCRGCSLTCRYRRYVEESKSGAYLFQICNHNFLLADAIHRGSGKAPLLPEYGAVVIDEAHKLPEAARQMFTESLSQEQMLDAISGLEDERFLLAAERLGLAIAPLIADLNALGIEEDRGSAAYPITRERKKLFTEAEKQIEFLCKLLMGDISKLLMDKLHAVQRMLSLFLNRDPAYIRYAAVLDDGHTGLCMTNAHIDRELRRILWDVGKAAILTSGTLAVGNDFTRIREELGLLRIRRKIVETVSLSSFAYKKNCLLYLPPRSNISPDKDTTAHLDHLAEQIAKLICTTKGRTLILFTAYAAMSEIHARLLEKHLPYPLFPVRRNAGQTVEQFKSSGNGVLLGTGALWEGMDFPGEIVSSLIIPRLPFAVPDPIHEAKRNQYLSLRDYIKAVVLPDMQIKLRQGFGRAIRIESDHCVISILDERALPGRRYYHAVRMALPEMRETRDIEDVRTFQKSKSSAFQANYEEAAHERRS